MGKKRVGGRNNRGRQIIESKSFASAVERLGGARLVDEALETIHEALRLNPYEFTLCESDHYSFRYAMTRPIGVIPALVFVFTIGQNGAVYLEHVEEAEWAI